MKNVNVSSYYIHKNFYWLIKIIKDFKNELKYLILDKISRLLYIKKFLSLPIIKLNLGCGNAMKKGFINIDLLKNADLRLDLRKNLPFKENSVDFVFSEHFLEHLDYLDTTVICCLKDYYRILKNGGKIRLSVPDIEKIIKAYINKDMEYLEDITPIENQLPHSKKYATKIDYINYFVYQYGEHKYSYDYEKLNLLLKIIGYKNIIKDEFHLNEDTKEKKRISLYINAEK